jgi:2-oxoisovalerate dehydrogenase E1 component alpha subunit
MPGVRVDGNDILAIIQTSREAVDRARAGDGPTLIEARTYRISGHSSSDDPTRYRDPNESEAWKERDPIHRFRGYLKEIGLWTEQWEQETIERYTEEIVRVHAESDKLGPPPLDTLFEEVYEEMPWHLREQREWLLAQARTKSPHTF